MIFLGGHRKSKSKCKNQKQNEWTEEEHLIEIIRYEMRAHTQDVHFDVRCAIQLSTLFYSFAFFVCGIWTLNLVIGMSSTWRCSNFRRIVNKTQMGTVRWFSMRIFSVLVVEKTMDSDAESKKTHKNSSHTDEVEYNRSTTAKSAQFRARQQLWHCIHSLKQDTCIAICENLVFVSWLNRPAESMSLQH